MKLCLISWYLSYYMHFKSQLTGKIHKHKGFQWYKPGCWCLLLIYQPTCYTKTFQQHTNLTHKAGQGMQARLGMCGFMQVQFKQQYRQSGNNRNHNRYLQHEIYRCMNIKVILYILTIQYEVQGSSVPHNCSNDRFLHTAVTNIQGHTQYKVLCELADDYPCMWSKSSTL